MKKIFGILAFVSFFYALGIVGGIEQDFIGLKEGVIRLAIGIVCFGVFAELSGATEPPDYTDTERESRPRERHSRRRQA